MPISKYMQTTHVFSLREGERDHRESGIVYKKHDTAECANLSVTPARELSLTNLQGYNELS